MDTGERASSARDHHPNLCGSERAAFDFCDSRGRARAGRRKMLPRGWSICVLLDGCSGAYAPADRFRNS